MKSLLLIAGLLSLSSVAMADQCQYVTKDQAQKALKIALETSKVESLCEPCGEARPQKVDVKSIGIQDVNSQGYWGLMINNQNVDLAYTYVNGLNLAKLAGCEAQDVSLSLQK